jgi:hypothetical protein
MHKIRKKNQHQLKQFFVCIKENLYCVCDDLYETKYERETNKGEERSCFFYTFYVKTEMTDSPKLDFFFHVFHAKAL